ncbi:hypothetical protein BGX29_005070, partial [Mortierella sp. GBA35]
MNNCSGLSENTLRGYQVVFRRWKTFCEEHAEEYSGVDGKELYLVNSEDKLIAFMEDQYFTRDSKKHVQVGADFKSQVPVPRDKNGDAMEVNPSSLADLIDDAPEQKDGRKVIMVPLGSGSIQTPKKVLARLHGLQLSRKELT